MTDRHPACARTRAEQVGLLRGIPIPPMLCFWGHALSEDGVVTKTCLSQWYPSPFTIDGVRYATAEHCMMAEKARLFGDEAALRQILATPEPQKAKKLGRMVAGFISAVWERERFTVVVRGNLARFRQRGALRDFLLSTGEAILVEASPRDDTWGIGASEDDPRAANPSSWPGENLLGLALMEMRALLSSEALEARRDSPTFEPHIQ